MKKSGDIKREVGDCIYQEFQNRAGQLIRYAENVDRKSPESAFEACINQLYLQYIAEKSRR